VRCDAVQTGCLLAGVSKEPAGLIRSRHGGSSSHGDFGMYQATVLHTWEDRGVGVVILHLEELKSSWFDFRAADSNKPRCW
jgi:hypothetical protein